MADRIARPRTASGPATWAYWTAVAATVMVLMYLGWMA